MNKIVCLITFLTSCFHLQVLKCQSLEKAPIKGMVIYNKPSFKHFAILMQDTTLSGNRFDNWFDWSFANSKNPDTTIQYQPYILDTCSFLKCEYGLLNGNILVEFYNTSEKNRRLKRNVRKYIRLYIGYIDTSGSKKIVVQFITQKEFKKREYIYSNELFLITKQKKLRFAVIHLKLSLAQAW